MPLEMAGLRGSWEAQGPGSREEHLKWLHGLGWQVSFPKHITDDQRVSQHPRRRLRNGVAGKRGRAQTGSVSN